MGDFERGVKGYIMVYAAVEAAFPVDLNDVVHGYCEMCRYFHKNNSMCLLTREIVVRPDRYIGYSCPMEFETEE